MLDNLLIGFAALLLGYLAGSISFARVVTRLVSPQTDLKATLVPVEGIEEKIPMSAVSATSVRFQLGPRYGCLASILDMVKVALPVAAFKILFPGAPAQYLAAMGGLIGHNWPLYYQFNGGYGQSAIYGGLLLIDWIGLPINFLGTGIFYVFIRQVHIASVGGILLLIPWFWFFRHDAYGVWYATICSVAYGIRVLPDFRALREKQRQAAKPAKETR
jgi:acyl phosphate:glycerol-3-phosphate acyltransferase